VKKGYDFYMICPKCKHCQFKIIGVIPRDYVCCGCTRTYKYNQLIKIDFLEL
jgi:hypothetical protein